MTTNPAIRKSIKISRSADFLLHTQALSHCRISRRGASDPSAGRRRGQPGRSRSPYFKPNSKVDHKERRNLKAGTGLGEHSPWKIPRPNHSAQMPSLCVLCGYSISEHRLNYRVPAWTLGLSEILVLNPKEIPSSSPIETVSPCTPYGPTAR